MEKDEQKYTRTDEEKWAAAKQVKDGMYNDRDVDEYTYLLPTEKNADVVAKGVYGNGSVYFALTEGRGSHFEIFISQIKYKMTPFVRLNGRIAQWEEEDELFVCISGLTRGHIFKKGAEPNDPHPNYVKEKLGGNLQTEVYEFIGKILGSYYRIIQNENTPQ